MVRLPAARGEALLDFLLEAVAEEGTAPFPAHVLAALRRAVPCDAVSYHEWSPGELLEFSFVADEPGAWLAAWRAYPRVRRDDPLAGGPGPMPDPSPLPDREWLGRALAISDFLSDREFRSRGLYAEVCRPLGVRAVLKLFLPAHAGTGASLVLSTTRRSFLDSDRITLQRIIPHLVQLRRSADSRKTYEALMTSAATAQARLRRLTPSERVVLARAAAGETN